MVCNSIYSSWHMRARLCVKCKMVDFTRDWVHPWRTYCRLQNLKCSFKYVIAYLKSFFLMKFVLNQLLGRPQLKCADCIISHLYTVNYEADILLRTAAFRCPWLCPSGEPHTPREKALLRIRMSFISQVCLHIRGICYSDRSVAMQQDTE